MAETTVIQPLTGDLWHQAGEQNTESPLKTSQAQTHEMIDAYQGLVDLYDAYENPNDEQLATALPYKLRRQFNNENGITGAGAYQINRPAIERYIGNIRTQRANAADAAKQAAIDAANADIEVANGTDTPYKVTKDFSDWYKNWKTAYGATTDQTKRANMVKTLAAKMQEAGLPSMDVADAGKDAKGNPIDPYYAYMEQFLGDGSDPTKFTQMLEVMQAAEKDRTPKEPEEKTWEEKWLERQEQRAVMDKAAEERRLQRERLGYGIGELAATIGDIVRASQGAPVTQRDWQKYYDALTAQEQANLNNYRVRMQKLAEDARADRARKDAMAAAAAKDAADKQFALQLEAMKLQGALGKQAASDAAAMERASVAAKSRTDAASIAAGAKKESSETSAKGKPVRFAVGGKTYDVLGGTSFTTMMNNILSVLNNPANTAPEKKYNRISFKPEELQTDGQGFYNRRIIELLSPENMENYTPMARTMIENIVKSYLYDSKAGGTFGNKSERPW